MITELYITVRLSKIMHADNTQVSILSGTNGGSENESISTFGKMDSDAKRSVISLPRCMFAQEQNSFCEYNTLTFRFHALYVQIFIASTVYCDAKVLDSYSRFVFGFNPTQE